ncbi:MAG: Gx transporter family protein [Limnochordales bacterium]|nr:Gx transporter family protein [Limnochordales bacterium]
MVMVQPSPAASATAAATATATADAAGARFPPRTQPGRKVAQLGVLLAIAITLYVFESLLPSLPLPGAKLGLANLVSLLAVLAWGWREAMMLVVARQLLGSLATGTFLSAPFFFGLAGGIASVVTMRAAACLGGRRISPAGVSIVGAATHNVAQLMVARLFTGEWAILAYLPYLLWFSLPTGTLVGVAGAYLLPYLASCNHSLAGTAARTAGPAPAGNRNMEKVIPGVLSALYGIRSGLARRLGLHLKLQTGDSAAAAALFLAALVAFFWQQGTAAPPLNPEGVVRVAGVVRVVVPLDREQVIPLELPGGRMVLEVAPGKIRVRESTCPDRICVRTGWINNPAQAIVCVPLQTVVTVRGAATPQYDIMSR